MLTAASSRCRLVIADGAYGGVDLSNAIKEAGFPVKDSPRESECLRELGLLEMDVLLEIETGQHELVDFFPSTLCLKNWKAFVSADLLNTRTILVLARKEEQDLSISPTANKEVISMLRNVLEQPNRASLPSPDTDTVMVVEDEAMLRSIFRRVLQGNGYFVLEAANGAEAVFLAQRFTHPIHLLITDLSMPKLNGFEVAAQLAALHSETRVLFLSGYSEGVLPGHQAPDKTAAFLQKPFKAEALVEKARAVLGARAKS
jgi:CheY-like chemotaxis protein